MNVNTINFTGTSCTGKTSVFKTLKELSTFNSYDNFFESISRKLLREKGLKLNGSGGVETQNILTSEYFDLLYNQNSYISERCLIDVCAFTGCLKDKSKGSEFLEYSKLELKIFQLLNNFKDKLGLVVYFPIEFELVKDGERLEDEQMREAFDKKIQKILELFDIEHIRVTGPIHYRVDQIVEAVGNYKKF